MDKGKPLKNPVHEAFCHAYIQTGGKISQSYEMSAGAVGRKNPQGGSQLLGRPDVKARIERIRQDYAKRAAITAETLVDELEEARQLGAATSAPSAMVAATMGKAKLLGLATDKVKSEVSLTVEHILGEITNSGSSRILPRKAQEVSDYDTE